MAGAVGTAKSRGSLAFRPTMCQFRMYSHTRSSVHSSVFGQADKTVPDFYSSVCNSFGIDPATECSPGSFGVVLGGGVAAGQDPLGEGSPCQNTHGGPVHNAHQQVMNGLDEPIPRLYVAGELGGVFGHLYLAGGNLAECFVGGWTAGRHAAGLDPW